MKIPLFFGDAEGLAEVPSEINDLVALIAGNWQFTLNEVFHVHS